MIFWGSVTGASIERATNHLAQARESARRTREISKDIEHEALYTWRSWRCDNPGPLAGLGRAVPADRALPGANTSECNMPEHIARDLTGGGPYP